MKFSTATSRITASLALLAVAGTAFAQQQRGEKLQEPVFRVAHETPATPVSAQGAPTTAILTSDDAFFDLTQAEDEHPLAPCKRFAERVKAHIEENVNDYSCTFAKMERIDGTLQEANYIQMEVMHDPFSVHLFFKQPKSGQECLYVEGQHQGNMRVRAHGWRGTIAGVLTIDPNGSLAMDGQRHPITKAGVKNLTNELIRIAENDMKYGECEVKTYPDVKLGKGENARSALMMEITHPVPRREFKFHLARVYVDKELKIPVRFEAYNWTKDANGKPELEELYMYSDVKVNSGLTANHFSESNPAIFKK